MIPCRPWGLKFGARVHCLLQELQSFGQRVSYEGRLDSNLCLGFLGSKSKDVGGLLELITFLLDQDAKSSRRGEEACLSLHQIQGQAGLHKAMRRII